jgi:type IV fimbrial biogenesis protein FimT
MNNRSRGFTLMELMIVVALVGLILAIGAPSFGEFRRSNRMAGVANDFLVGIQIARSEALKRQTGVSMCPSDTPEADAAVCTDDMNFAGWIVFADPNNNCQREVDDDREVILQIGTRVDTATSPGRRTTSVADGNCIGFAATGFTRQTPGPGLVTARHTLFCDDRGDAPQPGTELSSSRGVDLSPTGRARVTRVIRDGKLDGFDIGCGGGA